MNLIKFVKRGLFSKQTKILQNKIYHTFKQPLSKLSKQDEVFYALTVRL